MKNKTTPWTDIRKLSLRPMVSFVGCVACLPLVILFPMLCVQFFLDWHSESFGGSLLFMKYIVISIGGMAASYILHEAGHIWAARRWYPQGTKAAWNITLFRLSLVICGAPHELRVRALVGGSGPMACVAIGVAMSAVGLPPWLWGWYICHGVFLLPVFSDGVIVWNYMCRKVWKSPS